MIKTIWPSLMSIKNFRNFKNIQFNLGKQITLISGQNGAGKSNLLSLIASSSGLSKKSELGSNFQPDFNDFFVIDDSELYKAYSLYVDFSNESNQYVLRKKLTFKDDRKSERGIRIIPRTTKMDPKDNRKLHDIEVEGREKYGVGGAARVPIPTIYLSLSRLYPLGEKREDIKVKNLASKNGLYHKNADVKFAEWYNKVIPNSVNLNGKLSIIEKTKISKRSSFYMNMNNNISALSQSVGQDNLGSIISALVDVYLLSLQPDYHGALVCIDEIDVSLHPDSQIRLFNLMVELAQTLNIQFVITSHSLTFIKELSSKAKRKPDDYKIVYLKNPSMPYIAQNVDYYSLKADLFNELNHISPKPKIYFEDEVGQELFMMLLEALEYQLKKIDEADFRDIRSQENFEEERRSLAKLKDLVGIDKKIEMIPMELGCEELIKLSIPDRDKYFKRIVFILDGDARIKNGTTVTKPEVRNYLLDEYSRNSAQDRSHGKNVCFFPGYFAPESYLYKILYELAVHQGEHTLFWRALDQSEVTEMYTPDRILQQLNSMKKEFTNDDVKALFEHSLWKFYRSAHPLKYYFNSCDKLPVLIAFWNDFLVAYNISKSLTLQNRYI